MKRQNCVGDDGNIYVEYLFYRPLRVRLADWLLKKILKFSSYSGVF
jgi:hypothetical protein